VVGEKRQAERTPLRVHSENITLWLAKINQIEFIGVGQSATQLALIVAGEAVNISFIFLLGKHRWP